jgi:hypothetical protein
VYKLSSIEKTHGAKTHKMYSHVGILEGVVFWLLASCVKVERTKFHSRPITLLESFVCLINGRGAKCPVNIHISLIWSPILDFFWCYEFNLSFSSHPPFNFLLGKKILAFKLWEDSMEQFFSQGHFCFLWDLGLWVLTIGPSHSYSLAYSIATHLISIEFQNINNIWATLSKKTFSFPSIVIILQSVQPLLMDFF